MANGGARPGCGRKSKEEKYGAKIERAQRRIADRLPFLVDKMLELAGGVTLIDTEARLKQVIDTLMGCGGSPEQIKEAVAGLAGFYRTPPDREAIKDCLNRIMGKPQEHRDHTSLGQSIAPPNIIEVRLRLGGEANG